MSGAIDAVRAAHRPLRLRPYVWRGLGRLAVIGSLESVFLERRIALKMPLESDGGEDFFASLPGRIGKCRLLAKLLPRHVYRMLRASLKWRNEITKSCG
ncbi:hypothetical protein [uncultured Ferrovibrio sp.]|uniref:hypothetical protein n=1 Tax=uncultured Ferrovibrio sp. TaxID=1576913 RepID=UPI0026159B6A|nr:hypothetical protein [uncultured Ferrovibrio sp.]